MKNSQQNNLIKCLLCHIPSKVILPTNLTHTWKMVDFLWRGDKTVRIKSFIIIKEVLNKFVNMHMYIRYRLCECSFLCMKVSCTLICLDSHNITSYMVYSNNLISNKNLSYLKWFQFYNFFNWHWWITPNEETARKESHCWKEKNHTYQID